jgi:Fe(3+) dicitrate transport protein
MFGRLRTFRHLGGELRTEWANRNILGFNQDIQAGIRYEYQDMTNRNFLGTDGQILEYGDSTGATLFDRSLNANTVSAFLQTNIAVARDFNVLPGIRFEWYDINRTNRVVAEEESEAEEYDENVAGIDDCDDFNPALPDECLAISGLDFTPQRKESSSNFRALPGIAFAYTGLYRSTVFGGYHRGMSTGVLRNEDFPAPDEIGDNFNLGFRSSAIKGFDYEVAGFYQLIQDYQYGASFSDAGDRSYGRAKEVEISGVELAGRLNSQPFTGGPLNFFTEGNYTYARGVFTDAPAFDDDGNVIGSFNGNHLPEVPFHVAALTVGVEGTTGWRWNASTTWTYRGSFYTDEGNLGYGTYGPDCVEEDPINDPGEYECEADEAGEDGQVPSVWILSARFNLDLGNTGASVFVAGDNLLNEFYISDREDGIKPGMARTVWTGFKYKF